MVTLIFVFQELKAFQSASFFPIIHMSSLMSKIKKQAIVLQGNVLDYAKNIRVPTLIVHGIVDNFVPWNVWRDVCSPSTRK